MASLVMIAFVFDKIREADRTVGALALMQVIGLSLFAKKVSSAMYRYFLRKSKDLKKMGEWAVVTGATDGIGKAYAMGLASKGLSVVLISRTASKLEDVQKEIKEKYPSVEVKIVVCDYSKFDDAAEAKVKAALPSDIGVLINNVGVSYRYPQYYHEISQEEAMQLVDMNVTSTTKMTRMVLPGMVERKRGAIVNISSGSAMYTLPLLAGYSAAKSYIEKYSRAINAEYPYISCQCQIPFYVATKLAKMRPSFMVPTPEKYVKLGMGWIGQPEAVASPYWAHALQGWVLDCLPDSVVSTGIMSMHQGIRKRGQKKDRRLAEEAKKST